MHQKVAPSTVLGLTNKIRTPPHNYTNLFSLYHFLYYLQDSFHIAEINFPFRSFFWLWKQEYQGSNQWNIRRFSGAGKDETYIQRKDAGIVIRVPRIIDPIKRQDRKFLFGHERSSDHPRTRKQTGSQAYRVYDMYSEPALLLAPGAIL